MSNYCFGFVVGAGAQQIPVSQVSELLIYPVLQFLPDKTQVPFFPTQVVAALCLVFVGAFSIDQIRIGKEIRSTKKTNILKLRKLPLDEFFFAINLS